MSLTSIAWHIIVIWQCKHISTYHWLETLNNYCSPYFSTFIILLIGTWNMGSWWNFWKQKFWRFFRMSKVVDLHALVKHVLIEYKNLVVKMSDDLVGNVITNLTTMSCYVTMRLSWCWVVCCPCWRQCKVCWSCPKVEIHLYKILWPLWLSLLLICMQMYEDLLRNYDHFQFQMFNDLVQNTCDVFHKVWYLEPWTHRKYVVFQFNGNFLMMNKTSPNIGLVFMVIKEDWGFVVQFI